MNKALICVLAAVLVVLACSTLVASHPAGPAEKTGEVLDRAGNAVAGAARDGANAVGRGAQNVGDKISDTYKDTKNAINDNLNGAPATTSAVSMLLVAVSSFMVIKAAGIFA